MKTLPSMSLVVALSLCGCGPDADPGAQMVQRDVYTGPDALEKCVADWGNTALCNQRISAEEAKQMASAQRQSGGGGFSPVIFYSGGYGFYGPGYSGATRTATYNGQTFTPALNRSRNVAGFDSLSPGAKPLAFTKPKPFGVTTTSRPMAPSRVTTLSRGVFGATAARASGGSSAS